MSRVEIPYGAWPSPITAADVARGSRAVGGGAWVNGEIWWAERRPEQQGRTSICRFAGDSGQGVAGGAVEDILPAPWNARDRVHEYGGGAWTAYSDEAGRHLAFTNFDDQRVHRLTAGSGQQPTPLTPEPAQPAGARYGDLQMLPGGSELLCIRERHHDGRVTRDIAAVPLDGSAATDESRIRSVAGGSHFVGMPQLSPDGTRLAWIAWEHPQMPWDGTELRVATIGADGRCGEPVTLLGSTTESVLQPQWLSDDEIVLLSDRSNWWNLYRISASGGEAQPLAPMDAEVGGPLWQLSMRWYVQLSDGRIAFVRNDGADTLWMLDPRDGSLAPRDLPGLDALAVGAVDGSRMLLSSGGPAAASGLRVVDLDAGEVRDVRLAVDELPPAEWLPAAQVRTFTAGARDVHAIVYPPASPDAHAPAGELPPYIVHVHGGPTSQVKPHFDIAFAYWTSRGVGIIDVNYGGSTGYGRDYRERLKRQWGIVDVEDVIGAAQGLADAGEADWARLAIEGGSAGGWTVLAALTTTDEFACGVSYYGVAELLEFAKTTHDFEARYLDGLIGSLPEDEQLYIDRAPLTHVDELSVPVLLLQGLDDPVVPPAQAELFRDALARNGLPHAYLAFEGESHGFRRAETTIRCLEASLSFYGQVMGFDPPGVERLPLD
jgi:dipeptidyl aminopeptidase/acylaminoacyl peptidase